MSVPIAQVPIVPYNYGGGQAPLQTFLPSHSPSASTPLVILPEYPPAAVAPIVTSVHPSPSAPDASDLSPSSSIDITLDSRSQGHSSANAYKPSYISVGGGPNNLEVEMKSRKGPLALLGTFLGLFTFSGLYRNVFPNFTPVSEQHQDSTWVESSGLWVDSKICYRFGSCGLKHLHKAGWADIPQESDQQKQHSPPKAYSGHGLNYTFNNYWTSGKANPEEWSENERLLRRIPEYVLEYAPYVHLYSEEEFWPCDVAEHLIHTTPHLNYTPLQASSDHPNLTDLDDLNLWGEWVFLQSDDNVEDRPAWLSGETNIPNHLEASQNQEGHGSDWASHNNGDKRGDFPHAAPGRRTTARDSSEANKDQDVSDGLSGPLLELRSLGKHVREGRSEAPAVLIVVNKGDGIVDAFWFFFYSYNLGNKVFNIRFGNHVGDWEHTAVRFVHGQIEEVWFSEHNWGSSYRYEAVEKIGKRPVVYSATGTHAMYGTAGTHPYVLPGGILHDVTDHGPLWDPLQNMHSFTYDYVNDTLRSSTLTPHAPVGWFHFIGRWGDKIYPMSDPRQYRIFDQYHYVTGPLGPKFKNLDRQHLCPDGSQCEFKTSFD